MQCSKFKKTETLFFEQMKKSNSSTHQMEYKESSQKQKSRSEDNNQRWKRNRSRSPQFRDQERDNYRNRRENSRSPKRRDDRGDQSRKHENDGHYSKSSRNRSRSREQKPQKPLPQSNQNDSINKPSHNEPEFAWGKPEGQDSKKALITGTNQETANEANEEKTEPEYKPDFGLSGALAKDEKTGNIVNGIILKFTEPYEAALPIQHWRLYVYRGNDLLETLHIHRKSCFLFGRDDRIADIPIRHPSCSLQHAVIQFREIGEHSQSYNNNNEENEEDLIEQTTNQNKIIKPYLMDLQSSHGTYLNHKRIEDSRYYQLREGDVIQFAGSEREYVLLHDQSAT
jgi:smad nuclear-interacting protein 1